MYTHTRVLHPQPFGHPLALLQRAVGVRGQSAESLGATRAHHLALHDEKSPQQFASPSQESPKWVQGERQSLSPASEAIGPGP